MFTVKQFISCLSDIDISIALVHSTSDLIDDPLCADNLICVFPPSCVNTSSYASNTVVSFRFFFYPVTGCNYILIQSKKFDI